MLAQPGAQARDLHVVATVTHLGRTHVGVPARQFAESGRERLSGVRAAWMEVRGMRRRSTTTAGAVKSATLRRRIWRSTVRTCGRGSPSSSNPASSTTANPERRPVGTAMTSPGSRRSSDCAAWARVSRADSPGGALLQVVEFPADRRVFGEVTEVALHRFLVALDDMFVALDGGGQTDDRLVGLVLREGRLQDLAGHPAAHPTDEIDRHVVRGAEGGPQRVGYVSMPGLRGGWAARPGSTARRRTLDVDTAPTGPPGQLCMYSPA